MDTWFTTLKTLHIISVIAWMAGLLYIFRLYVYHRMESEAVVMERFKVMERRLYYAITVPAFWGAAMGGFGMIALMPCHFLSQGWMTLKLAAVAGMTVVHFMAGHYRKRFAAGEMPLTHVAFRYWNEVPTLLMIIIVALVEFQPAWWTYTLCP